MTEPSRPLAVLTYDGLPLHRGGAHRIRIKSPSRVWDIVVRFLRTYTTYAGADDIHLVLYEGPRVDAAYFQHAHAEATALFSDAAKRSIPSGDGLPPEMQHTWTLSGDRISEAIRLVDTASPPAPHWLGGPMWLGLKATFRLCDPVTSILLPAQGASLYGNQEADRQRLLGESCIYLRLAHPSTCAMFLTLPWTDMDRRVQQYVQALAEGLPFSLSNKCFSRWQLNAKGTAYYRRRISTDEEVLSGR